MSEDILTIAVVNFKPDAGQKIENLRRMKGFAAAASKRGADLILFPEMCLMGYDYYISQQKHWMETAQKQWLRFQKNMEITLYLEPLSMQKKKTVFIILHL